MKNLKIKLEQDLKDFDAKKIKAIAIDIDGTLINEHTICTERTEKAVKALIQTGREVYIVTGRSTLTAMPFAKQIGIPNYMINYNGASVWNMQTQKRENEHTLDSNIIQILIKLLRDRQMMSLAYVNDQFYYEIENAYLEQYFKRITIPGFNKPLDELPMDLFHKLFIMGSDEEIIEMHKLLSENYGDKLSIFLTTPGMHNLTHPENPARCIELMAKGVNKGEALTRLLRQQNITMDEAVAFGDDNNDIEMLESVAWGVAMHNARSTVKKVARLETLSHNDDGVAYFIENYLL